MTVEVTNNDYQAHNYRKVHKFLYMFLGGGADEATGEGRINQAVHRLLCHAVYSTALHNFTLKFEGHNTSTWIPGWSGLKDHGAQRYHTLTKLDNSPSYRDRITMAQYVAKDSPKFSVAAGIVLHVCYEEDKKLIIYVN